MKAKRMLALLLATLMLVSLFAATAFATPGRPYNQYGVSITNGENTDIASASITRCACVPVDNYLKVGLQVQYQAGNYYYWIPSETTIYVSEGEDCVGQSQSISHANIIYAQAHFWARCGTGEKISFSAVARNTQ